MPFVPTYMTKDHHRKDRKCFEGKEPIDFVTRMEAMRVSRLSSGDFLEPKKALESQTKIEKRNIFFLERKMGITGVPFGRTELSLRLSVMELCALLHGQGYWGWFLQGIYQT